MTHHPTATTDCNFQISREPIQNSPQPVPFGVPFPDLLWLKEDALEDSANLPAPGIIAQEIADDLEAALEEFDTITEDLKK